MPGVRITSQAAREGCLDYVGALGVLTTAQLMELRQHLLCYSARAVSEAYWTKYWALKESDDPSDCVHIYVFDERLVELGYSLQRLAEEPSHFRQYFHSQQAAA